MSERKKVRREIEAVWDQVRRERRESAKLKDGAQIIAAAHRLASYASELTVLAERLGASPQEAPAASATSQHKRKRAAKKAETKTAEEA